MSKKDEYFAMMESQIRKWDAEVDKLRAKGEHLSAEAPDTRQHRFALGDQVLKREATVKALA